jgi:Domain of unknown function (DUF4349)
MDTAVQDPTESLLRVDHRPWWQRRRWVAAAVALVVAVTAVAFAVGGGGPATSSTPSKKTAQTAAPITAGTAGAAGAPQAATASTGSVAAAPSSGGPSSGGSSLAAAGSGAPAVAPAPGIPTVTPRIVRTGDLDLSVPKGSVSHTLDRLTAIATLDGGYVADSQMSDGGQDPSGEVTLRIPVKRFDDAIARASALGTRVSLQTAGQDVTGQYVDLAARISALQATRATFLALLAKATTIGDTLAVQEHVTDVQTQIEQLQGQLNVLADQSALSALTVTVDQRPTPTPSANHHRSGLTVAVDRSVGRFVRGFEAIIGVLGPILLVLVVAVALWLIGLFGVRGYRRLRRLPL